MKLSKASQLIHEFESVPLVVDALRRFSPLQDCLLMESARQTVAHSGKALGRYSFLMADPTERVVCRSLDSVDAALAKIDSMLSVTKTPVTEGLPPMQGGVAGLFSYDLNRAFESIEAPKNDEFETPLLAVGLYDVVLAWDHELDRAWLISNGWTANANERMALFLELLEKPLKQGADLTIEDSAVEIEGQSDVPGPAGLVSNLSKEDYVNAVSKSIDYIYAGDIFQVNIAQRLLMKANCDSVELYERLRSRNPAPFAAYYDFGDGQIVSASPERLISVRDGLVETRPIKGTRSRTGRPMVDIQASQKLSASEKDRAENTMIVDLMRNDLSRICHDDSVTVTQLCELEVYQSVMHLVSAVEGKLREESNRPSEILKAIFPGGSITGAPKVRAMEIIAELEPSARGAYCGSLGYFAANGSADLNILIRSITASKGHWQIPVGGGIVSQSRPESEYEETWTKAAGMLSATNVGGRRSP